MMLHNYRDLNKSETKQVEVRNSTEYSFGKHVQLDHQDWHIQLTFNGANVVHNKTLKLLAYFTGV